ncbi:hypothetical protein [Alkalinema sp. FACHB-956]|uniref:hypothetical protein n=1 Tax=Alkalinema sp. FACHB-956 TaxID=2692768 RepID=UPI001688470C|nr:hypothetical protein [Alkalinema sp. FACHB-956]MBD2326014.1 hypothetical protein [Alkalinema sp. FACHB-956]
MIVSLFVGISIVLLITSRYFFKRHRDCAKVAIATPIYLHPFTKVILEDTASKETLSAQSSLFIYQIFAFLGVWVSLSSIAIILAEIISARVESFLLIVTLLLLAFILYSVIYIFSNASKLEPQVRIKRKRHCAFCKTPFIKQDIQAIDFLHDTELAEYHAGLIQCRVNTEFCLDCSFPISRETLDLSISSFIKDESTICPKCKNRTFIVRNISEILTTERIGDAGYRNFMQQCNYCGCQVEKQPRITLLSLEPTIKSAIYDQYTTQYQSYSSSLIAAIQRMIRLDRAGKNRLSEPYHIIDNARLRKNRTPSLREIKYLSTDDLERAIEFIHKCVERREVEEQAIADSAPDPY